MGWHVYPCAVVSVSWTNSNMALNSNQSLSIHPYVAFIEEFEDTIGVIRIRKSLKNRQNNGQRTNIGLHWTSLLSASYLLNDNYLWWPSYLLNGNYLLMTVISPQWQLSLMTVISPQWQFSLMTVISPQWQLSLMSWWSLYNDILSVWFWHHCTV